MKSYRRRLRGFSLPELLVVLVIIGILVLIALPNLMPLISRAKATEAQQQLTYLHTLQRSNFYTYSRYSSSLDELGFEQSRLVTDGGQANYLVEIVEATEHGFRATATGRSTRIKICARRSRIDRPPRGKVSACTRFHTQLSRIADLEKPNPEYPLTALRCSLLPIPTFCCSCLPLYWPATICARDGWTRRGWRCWGRSLSG